MVKHDGRHHDEKQDAKRFLKFGNRITQERDGIDEMITKKCGNMTIKKVALYYFFQQAKVRFSFV